VTDVVVIGAGVNGLACALALANAGRKVVVVEKRATVGGLAAARSLDGGFTIPGIRHDSDAISWDAARALGLLQHGLARVDAPPVFASSSEGRGLLLHRDPARAREELAALSPDDADAYAAHRALLDRARDVVVALAGREPPPIVPRDARGFFEWARAGLAAHALSRSDTEQLLRAIPMSVDDYTRERFSHPLVSSTIALPGVLGDFAGPRSPGTAGVLLWHEAQRGDAVRGGPAAVVNALSRALASHGVVVRTERAVSSILVDGRRARGVTLVDGETIASDVVVGSCDPVHVLGDLVPPLSFEARVDAAVRAIRGRGTAAKLHLGLSRPLTWRARPTERFARVSIAEHTDEIERAFDDVKYGRAAARPVLDVSVPSVDDPSCAPPGGETVSVVVGGVPFAPRAPFTDAARAALVERALDVLETHAPGTRDSVVARELLTPDDLRAEFALSGGSLFHVERALDQLLFMRPARPFARATTPLPGLFLGASGSHPGPGVSLLPGLLAARAVLSSS